MQLFFTHMVEKEAEAKGTLVIMFIYGAVFAVLWFVVYAIALSRGIVG
jgi:flagellar biogenesis protein FliO